MMQPTDDEDLISLPSVNQVKIATLVTLRRSSKKGWSHRKPLGHAVAVAQYLTLDTACPLSVRAFTRCSCLYYWS